MLVGVPRPELCEPMARVLQSLGVRRAMVVCGDGRNGKRNLDELSTLGPSHGRGILPGTRLQPFHADAGKFSVAAGARSRICAAATNW